MPQYRQGDVFLEPELTLPIDCRPLDRKIVAWGEVTGHTHRFEAALADDVQLYEDTEGRLWIRVHRPAPLVHEEHETLHIEPGLYRYIPQREYQPGPVGFRDVVD
jgi:hypothetical protein